MGRWSKSCFGQENIGEVGLMVAGTTHKDFEDSVLTLFDEVLSGEDEVFHCFAVMKQGVPYSVIFNVYGGPAVLDALAVMHDGGCRNVLFVGLAAGYGDLQVGDVVVPDESHHLDGLYSCIDPGRKIGRPDTELKDKIIETLRNKGTEYFPGRNVSVPAVSFQPKSPQTWGNVVPDTVEMELAACLSRCDDIGIRAAGALIISDNQEHKFGSKDAEVRVRKAASKRKVIEALIEKIPYFALPPLPGAEDFDLDKLLGY